MNKFSLFLIALLFLIVSASGCTSDSVGNKTFNASGISFVYPADMNIDNNLTSDFIASVYTPTLDPFRSFMVTKSEGVPTPTYNQLENIAKQSVDNAQNLTTNKIKIDGIEAVELSYSTIIDNKQTKGKTIFFVKNSNLYSLNYMVQPPDKFNEEEYKMIINSFKTI